MKVKTPPPPVPAYAPGPHPLTVPNVTATHQRPVYQLHVIRRGTIITFAH